MTVVIDKFAVLVVSCDKYADLWPPFFKLFKRFWPDCEYKTYLLSNRERFNDPSVTTLAVGDDISWSDNLIKALKQMPEAYVLLFLDDLLLYDFVKAAKVTDIFKWMAAKDANYIRLNPTQKPDKPHNELIGLVSRGAIYRTSTVLSVWKKSTLLGLLKSGESAWDFEIYGTVRSDSYDGFYSTWGNCFPVINGVIKAKWQRGAVKKLRSLGIDIDLTKRREMGYGETMSLCLRRFRSNALDLFPAKYRRKIKNFALRGKYNYQPK